MGGWGELGMPSVESKFTKLPFIFFKYMISIDSAFKVFQVLLQQSRALFDTRFQDSQIFRFGKFFEIREIFSRKVFWFS